MIFSLAHYAKPYMLIRSKSEIQAIDLTTLKTSFVIGGLAGRAMEMDTVDNKLYFADNNGISRANVDDMCTEIIFRNIRVDDIAIDWLKRRIFWVEHLNKRIFMSDLNVTGKRVVISTTSYPSSIAVDPIDRYVLFTRRISSYCVIDVNHHILVPVMMKIS